MLGVHVEFGGAYGTPTFFACRRCYITFLFIPPFHRIQPSFCCRGTRISIRNAIVNSEIPIKHVRALFEVLFWLMASIQRVSRKSASSMKSVVIIEFFISLPDRPANHRTTQNCDPSNWRHLPDQWNTVEHGGAPCTDPSWDLDNRRVLWGLNVTAMFLKYLDGRILQRESFILIWIEWFW